MRENIKKLFSLFLCLAMAIGLLPMAALAEGSETDVSKIANAAYILKTKAVSMNTMQTQTAQKSASAMNAMEIRVA